MRALWTLAAALLFLIAGCGNSGKLQSKEAVQAAIEAHLQQRPNVMLAKMTLEVNDVKFTSDTADAEVRFRSKQSPTVAVSVRYKLRRAGDQWKVEMSTPSNGMGSSPHGGATPSAPATSGGDTALQSSH